MGTPPRPIRRICVFCGASAGRDPRQAELARDVGTELAKRGIGIVYGGGRVGLMGALADGALAAGGEVVGVIPRRLVDQELAHPDVTELRVVETLHERKALMAELSDAFIALPGGLGTLEELSEVLSWGQLDLHRKPSAVLDVDGYFEPLLAFLDRAVDEGFLPSEHRALLIVGRDLDELLDRFERYQAPRGRWERAVLANAGGGRPDPGARIDSEVRSPTGVGAEPARVSDPEAARAPAAKEAQPGNG